VMAGSARIVIGHLGWSQHRPGVEVMAGNDPNLPREARALLFRGVYEREGATVICVVLPGRFTPDAEVADLCERIDAALEGA
jgi:hypothetical protein